MIPWPWLIFGLILGALFAGRPAYRAARLDRARSDWRGAAAVHKSARAAFWARLREFVAAALGPAALLVVAYVLYRIGRKS